MTKKEKIVSLYQDKKNWRPPTYQSIADKVGVSKVYVMQVIRGLNK